MQTDYDEEVCFHAVRKLYDMARHRPDQPFLLFVSFTNPHDPWEIPKRHWERYRRSAIPDPAVPSLPLSALQVAVAMAVSSGAPGLEAAVVLGEDPVDAAGEQTVHDVAPGAPIHHAGPDGTLR